MTINVTIINTGLSNLESIASTFRKQPGVNVEVVDVRQTTNPDSKLLDLTNLVVFPGVGNFKSLLETRLTIVWQNFIKTFVKTEIKVLGICLGMHLFYEFSEESPGTEGLGVVKGYVLRFNNDSKNVPNIGWGELKFIKNQPTNLRLDEVPGDVYFGHSYFVEPINPDTIIAKSSNGKVEFPAIILDRNLLLFQFHPEKSGHNGDLLIKSVLKWVKDG
jgi:imidazole glycerol phosphate synthase glutamine amidotransferase subunit